MSEIRVGALRWIVQIVRRDQIADPDGSGIIETPADAMTVHADIQPMGALTYYGAIDAVGVEIAPTHRIIVRWTDAIDTRHAVLRTTQRNDGSSRTEVYRVRRVLADMDGRKRFTVLETQIETSQ